MSLVAGLLNQTLDTIYETTTNAYNDKTLTSKYTDVACRFQKTKRRMTDNSGENVTVLGEIWLEADYSDIDYNWVVEKDSKKYYIADIEFNYDLSGNLDHIVLYVR